MDNKINIQDLAENISTRTNVQKKDSEQFVRLFFDLIEQNLLQDKIVKVKGLGTFKLIEVADRESVDVNTGARIKITGHSKVSFVPDVALRDQVNKPFAAFETIVLNETTDVNDMEKLPEQLDAIKEIVDAENIPTTVPDELDVNEEVIIGDTNVVELESQDTVTETVPEEETAPMKEVQIETAPVAVVQDEPVLKIITAHEEKTEEITPLEEPASQQAAEMPVGSKQDHNHTGRNILYFLLVLALMISSYFAGYYRVLCPCLDCEQDKPKTEIAKPKIEIQKTDTTKLKHTKKIDNPADKYAQVPNGKYLIVGTKGIHVMKVGDSLLKLAIKEYGHKDYVNYIIVHNNFTNPDVIPLGYEVKLPELK